MILIKKSLSRLATQLLIVNCSLFICASARADYNPFFGDHTNQVAFHGGWGVNSGFLIPPPSQFVPFALTQFQYSRPNTFFTLPARASLNAIVTIGMGERYDWDWKDFSIPIAFVSQDVILLHGRRWYFGTGAGLGFQAHENERLGAKLLFGFKILAGYRINDNWNTEIFVQHFSNGNTAAENHSYGFYGLGVVYNF